MYLVDKVKQLYPLGKIAIIGLGVTGYSAAKYLTAAGISVSIFDTRLEPPLLLECQQNLPTVQLITGELNTEALNEFDTLILSPGVSPTNHALVGLEHTKTKLISDIELFSRLTNKPIVAITGTNGKSTVSALVNLIFTKAGLKSSLGGNYGTACLDLLQQNSDIYVLECSSFQLEVVTKFAPAVATILNISSDHLDRHVTMENYLAAKMRIMQNCKQAVINRQQELPIPSDLAVNAISFGLDVPSRDNFGLSSDGRYLLQGQEPIIATSALKISGQHNIANALAACACAKAQGVSTIHMRDALSEFTGLKHRAELVKVHNQVTWLNDSKATNVGATIAAVAGIAAKSSTRLILLLGGRMKESSYTELLEPLAKHCSLVITFGEAGTSLSTMLQNRLPTVNCACLKTAVNTAYKHAKPGDTVLLSPACSSFDAFNNFTDRGNSYSEYVNFATI